MSKEDDERLKNLLLFKCYATDKEMEEIMPIVGVIVVGFVVVVFLISFFGT